MERKRRSEGRSVKQNSKQGSKQSKLTAKESKLTAKKNTMSARQRTILHFLVCLIFFVTVLVGVRAAAAAIGERNLFSGEEDGGKVEASNAFVEKFGETERANFLLLGLSDGMTDTIMVASYDMKNQNVDLISVPRDSYYPREGHSGASNKINAIYRASKDGGVANTAKAVSDILGGMPIHYYMLIDYEGVANIVEAAGGITFNVPFYMKYEDSTKGQELYVDIPAGEQLLTKKNVVQFLRFRQTNPWYKAQGYKDYGDMDIGRMETQQAFMKEAFKQSIGPELPKVVKAVMENVESDLDMDMVWKLVTKAGGLNAENIVGHTLPGESKKREEASVWLLDEAGVQELLNQIYQRAEMKDEVASGGAVEPD